MIGFFTPKIVSTPFWLFLLLAGCSFAALWLRQRVHEARHATYAPLDRTLSS
jgi:hypothetical protein